MPHFSKQIQKISQTKELFDQDLLKEAMKFISFGIGCNCFSLISQQYFFDELLTEKKINLEVVNALANSTAVYSALLTLSNIKILEIKDNSFSLTDFGFAAAKFIGIINTLFVGYGKLISEQAENPREFISQNSHLLNGEIIARVLVQTFCFIEQNSYSTPLFS